MEEEIQKIAEQFQEDCHKTAEAIMSKKNSHIDYQDATNVWLFRKLAELQYQINNNRHATYGPPL